jgi:N-acetylmuramoyl-L-alanine amidase CwlA
MRIILVLTMLTIPLILPPALPAQSQQPWFGTWSLNLAKSTADGEARFKRATSKIEAWQDGLKVTYDLVGVRGGVTHMEWTGKFDGKDYAVQGVDYVLTHAYTRVNDRSYQIIIKIDGVVTATATVVISPDGKTLTTLTTGKNAQGNTVQTTSVYERWR